MIIKFGNLTVREFAARVGAQFTEDEIEFLESRRCDVAAFDDPHGFHIYDDPAISIHIGAEAYSASVPVFARANARSAFNREVGFYPQSKADVESIRRQQEAGPPMASGRVLVETKNGFHIDGSEARDWAGPFTEVLPEDGAL